MPRSLAAKINSCARGRGAVRMQCLLSGQEFSGTIGTGEQGPDIGISLADRSRHGRFIHCTYAVAGKAEGTLHSLQRGDSVCLYAGEGGDFFRRVVRAVKKLHPRVLVPFTDSATLRKILEQFERDAGTTLKHKRSVRKKMFGAMPMTSMEWHRDASLRRYQSVADVFRLAAEGDLVVESLRAFSGGDGGLDFAVSRGGMITVYGGDAKGVYDHVAQPMLDNGLGMRGRFAHRSRSELAGGELRPLLVRYGRDVFGSKSGRDEFCRMIGRYVNCRYSIVHAGNPHIYISIVDKTDHSSLAVRSVGNSSLAIIPQIRTSEASLMRLTGFLASSFREGTIGDYEP